MQAFFSPNKFIFHCHSETETGVQPNLNTYRHPDAANFNAWRRHLLLADPNPPDTILFAWEDIKAMFNGGNRTKKPSPCQPPRINDGIKPKTPDMPIDTLLLSPPPQAIFASIVAQRMAPLGYNWGDTGSVWWLNGSSPQPPQLPACLIQDGSALSIWTAQLREYMEKITQGIFLPPPPPPPPPPSAQTSSSLPSSSNSTTITN